MEIPGNGEDAITDHLHARASAPLYKLGSTSRSVLIVPLRITPSSPHSTLSRYSSLELSPNPGSTISCVEFESLVLPSTYPSEDHLRTYLVPFK